MKEKLIDFVKNEPVEKVLLIVTFILWISSFIEKVKPFELSVSPNWYRFSFGLGFFLIVAFFYIIKSIRSKTKFIISSRKKSVYKFSDIETDITVGDIFEHEALNNESTALILPANTSLDDECLNDSRSVLGSFVLKQIPQQKEEFNNILVNERQNDSESRKPVGHSFVLPLKTQRQNKVIVTCITEIEEKLGVVSYPENISLCVRGIFKAASETKVQHIVMPVIGSGHGGLELSESINNILLSASYYSKIHKKVKKLSVVIHNSKRDELANGLSIIFKK